MAKHSQAVAEAAGRDANVQDTFTFTSDSNQGIIFLGLKPRAQRPLSARETLASLRPKLAQVQGVLTFLQNPPPITISGQNSTSAYQMTVQSGDLQEIYTWVPRLMDRLRGLPGFRDTNSNLQIASPQLRVDINRDRARSLGISPQQIEEALFSAYGNRRVSTIFTPVNQYSVITELAPEYQESPNALSKCMSARPRVRLFRSTHW
jgi:HAE1 family hydrophobic/amphiphilic exporter-1